ncbi:esterase/lipase family protein [Solimonas marina]|uniref:Phospholipase n=1 Tax=Solimonas marina TaxID=2714601 RepID=A0A970B7R1_9GAMM|nr:phospholipase [Solimonas marina]NKF24158.1 phospholipase [Solimonas marina]
MGTRIVFVHGWSVTNTDTYGALPRWLAQQGAAVEDVYLGRYISFVDTVTLDDIARAFQQALTDTLGPGPLADFACITHSTGGPVVRLWMQLYHGHEPAECPLKQLIMLAPANHGSALAQLGKGPIGRLKSMADGVQPGTGVLDWLELGSDASWRLNVAWMTIDWAAAGIYPFVLTGQSIDRKFYDHLNSYTGEAGSDGVVRVAAANLNYGVLHLHQDGETITGAAPQRTSRTAFGVLPGRSHSGDAMGIIRSVTLDNAATHPTVIWAQRCLQVRNGDEYATLCDALDTLTKSTQKDEAKQTEQKFFGTKTYKTSRYSMLVFRFIDDRGNVLTDYDLLITGGPHYSPDDLPPGFFVDRQRNRKSPGQLTYYVDHDVLRLGLNRHEGGGRVGFQVRARPEPGPQALVYYQPIEFRSDEGAVADIVRANETLMVEIRLRRQVDSAVFRVDADLTPGRFGARPIGTPVG